jgi:phosphate transport system permease protein
MSASALDPSDLARRWTRRTWADVAATGLLGASFLVVAAPLLVLLSSLAARGAPPAFSGFPAFFVSEIPIRARQIGPGMGPAILGTVLVTGAAAALAVPLGVLAAVWLNEYGRDSAFARIVRLVGQVTASVPSVVMGLFVYLTFTLKFGLSGAGGALALACLMLPIVLRSTEEMLRLVPDTLRDAALALGASRSRVINTVVLPAALPGIVSGSLLAVARASGETAPLVFTIGASRTWNADLLYGANTALPAQIFVNAMLPFDGAQQRAWGAAFTLVALAFGLMFASRAVARRFLSPR